MKLILSFAGILAVIYALKFVCLVFKRLGSKDSMNRFMDNVEEKMGEGADKVAGYWKKRNRKKKAQKKVKPIVTIH